MLTLDVDIRERKRKFQNERQSGKIPAVFYGKKEEATPISLNLGQFLKIWKEAGESTVVVLKSPDVQKEALIYDVQTDVVTGLPIHVDFYVFEKGHTVEVSVPIKFIGMAPAVKELGGTLVKVLHELNIKAQPKDLPHEIEVDVSSLADFESQILAEDIKIPDGVTLMEKPEEVVALVEEIKEEEEEPVAEVDLSSIEVEKKGKKEEEEEVEGGESSEKGEEKK